MTKHGADASDARKHSRKYLWLSMGLVLLVAAYSAAWFAVAGGIKSRLPLLFEEAGRQGIEPECRTVRILGYPLRMSINCSAVKARFAHPEMEVVAGSLSSVAPVYNPRRITTTLEGPVIVTGLDDLSAQFDWARMRAETTFSRSGLEKGRVAGKVVSVSFDNRALPVRFKAEMGSLEAQAERKGADLDIGLNIVDFASPVTLDLRSLNFRGTLLDGAALLQPGPIGLHGKHFRLDLLEGTFPGGGAVQLSGTIAFDTDGYADADLRIRLTNLPAIAIELEEIDPDLAQQLRGMASALSALDTEPGDSPETTTLPIAIRHGVVSVGFFTLGEIPPLR